MQRGIWNQIICNNTLLWIIDSCFLGDRNKRLPGQLVRLFFHSEKCPHTDTHTRWQWTTWYCGTSKPLTFKSWAVGLVLFTENDSLQASALRVQHHVMLKGMLKVRGLSHSLFREVLWELYCADNMLVYTHTPVTSGLIFCACTESLQSHTKAAGPNLGRGDVGWRWHVCQLTWAAFPVTVIVSEAVGGSRGLLCWAPRFQLPLPRFEPADSSKKKTGASASFKEEELVNYEQVYDGKIILPFLLPMWQWCLLSFHAFHSTIPFLVLKRKTRYPDRLVLVQPKQTQYFTIMSNG